MARTDDLDRLLTHLESDPDIQAETSRRLAMAEQRRAEAYREAMTRLSREQAQAGDVYRAYRERLRAIHQTTVI